MVICQIGHEEFWRGYCNKCLGVVLGVLRADYLGGKTLSQRDAEFLREGTKVHDGVGVREFRATRGGHVRMMNMTPEQRSELSSRAGKARWSKYKTEEARAKEMRRIGMVGATAPQKSAEERRQMTQAAREARWKGHWTKIAKFAVE